MFWPGSTPKSSGISCGSAGLESEAFNEEATGALYDGRFYFDDKSNRVLFDCSNPVRKDGPPPSVVVG